MEEVKEGLSSPSSILINLLCGVERGLLVGGVQVGGGEDGDERGRWWCEM